MESQLKSLNQIKSPKNSFSQKQSNLQEEKLKGISSLVKDLKNIDNGKILCYFSWSQIKMQANLLLDYLSREKITNKTLFFDSLASLDSLLSIFKVNLFIQLKFSKNFCRNIQKEFQSLCLEFEQNSTEKDLKLLQFQLYSILFLLVMLIYFSGKKEFSQNKNLPLNIISKSFINNFISLDINITSKNQRIIGLIVAYLLKNINIKIYGQRMLKFILNHFDKITSPRTLYHFVYCLREIHLERQIDIKTIRKYGLIEKIINFWIQAFYNPQSVYLVDYINVILKKYKSLVCLLKTQSLLSKLCQFNRINQFSLVHQGLILEIKSRLLLSAEPDYKQFIFSKAFESCQQITYSLKFLSCFTHYLSFDEIAGYIFPYMNAFAYISKNKQTNCILFALEQLNHIVQKCLQNRSYAITSYLKDISEPILTQLKSFQIYHRDISLIQENFSKLISISQYTIC